MAGAGGADAVEDIVKVGGGDGVASVVDDIAGEFDGVGAAGAVHVWDFIIEGVNEIVAVGGEIGAGGDRCGGGLAGDIERH